MIRVLVIDDQKFKQDDIKKQFNLDSVTTDFAEEVRSSKAKISSTSYDLILLDMTIKNPLSPNEFAGMDILSYLEEIDVQTPVIVITQFYNFNDISESNGNSGYYKINEFYKNEPEYDFSPDKDIHHLPYMHEYLSQNFCNYFGCVLYMQNDTVWVDNLRKVLHQLGGTKYENIIT